MLSASRGKFARVCVEVDLNKPLEASYKLKGQLWKVQYESLRTLCFSCEIYGHSKEGCPAKLNIEEPNDSQRGHPQEGMAAEEVVNELSDN